MTRAEQVLPGRVPILCWRCGLDVSAGFDLIHIPGPGGYRNAAVCKGGCSPMIVKEST